MTWPLTVVIKCAYAILEAIAMMEADIPVMLFKMKSINIYLVFAKQLILISLNKKSL